MRKILYLVCAFILAWGCTREPQELNEEGMQEKSSFSVDEAKQFFEKHMSSALATRSTSDKNGFIPGDFTVDWANAVYSSAEPLYNIEFSIDAKFRFRVLQSELKNGIAAAYSVPVYQKLLMIKDVATEQISNYIMTLIPDHQFDVKHRNFDPQSFSIYGDHAEFSGLIVYSTLENVSWPVQVCIFRDGIKRANYSIFKAEPDFEAIIAILRNIEIARKAHVATRSGEDDWGDDGWDEDPIVGADGMTNEEWMSETNPGLGAVPDIVLPEYDYEGYGDVDLLTIAVKHKPCGTILGCFTIDELEDRTEPFERYCPKCKVYVWI